MKTLKEYAGKCSGHFDPEAKHPNLPVVGRFYLAEDVDKRISSLQRKIKTLEK